MLDATITTFMIYAAAAISFRFCSAEMGGMLREKSNETDRRWKILLIYMFSLLL
jgi:hypothetical protein